MQHATTPGTSLEDSLSAGLTAEGTEHRSTFLDNIKKGITFLLRQLPDFSPRDLKGEYHGR